MNDNRYTLKACSHIQQEIAIVQLQYLTLHNASSYHHTLISNKHSTLTNITVIRKHYKVRENTPPNKIHR
jgi:hypothetical protein